MKILVHEREKYMLCTINGGNHREETDVNPCTNPIMMPVLSCSDHDPSLDFFHHEHKKILKLGLDILSFFLLA